MDESSDSDSFDDIVNILTESGMKIKIGPRKKIKILEDVIIYKPDKELLEKITETNSDVLIPYLGEEKATAETVLVSSLEEDNVTELTVGEENATDLTVLIQSLGQENMADITYVQEYGISEDNNVLDVPNHEIVSIPPNLDSVSKPDNKRRKHPAPASWQKNVTKEKRMRGESYSGYSRDCSKKVKTGVPRSERIIGPACKSNYCQKTSTRHCSLFSEEVRADIFKEFWKELDWAAKQSLVCSLTEKLAVKQRKSEEPKRTHSLAYYLKLNGVRRQVCKTMFLNTLGLKERMVFNWISSESEVGIPIIQTNREKSGRGKPKSTFTPDSQGVTQNDHLNSFFEAIPKLPSHYCRSTSTKLYLEPVFKSKSHLYEIYTQKCSEDITQAVSRTHFLNKFEELNLSICKPKKDKCDVCCGFEVGNVSQVEYDAHDRKKKAARAEKDKDKKLALEGKATVLCMDVQSVKMCPKLQASAIYYKTKLCCHNYTVYNMATHEVLCYWWHECEAELQASNFASCLVDYILKKVPKTIPLIIYSDGCTAQNRNATMSNALLHVALNEKMSITQKYLEKGHTQMECDSVHSVIETKLKNMDVYLPHQYATITKDAKKKEPKYEVQYLTHDFFLDYHKIQRYQSIRPGKKSGDPTVTDLRQINYEPEGRIRYKLQFLDDLRELPSRPKPSHHVLKKMYTSQLPLKLKKWQDLQDLKAVIPVDCHSFYDNLPKE